MRRFAPIVAAVAIGLGSLLLGPITPATAEDPTCTPFVLDHTKAELLAGHMDAIDAGVAKMNALGANVRIRVEEGFPDGADGYVVSMLAKCPSWRGTKSRVDTNMILMVYATSVNSDYSQRPARILVGSHWSHDRGLDDGTLNKLIVNDMRPTLLKYNKDDQATWPDVAAGIVAGENALAGKMKPYNWTPIIVWGVVIVAAVILLLVWLARKGVFSGGGGGYRGYGGYGGTTIISTTNYGGGDSGGGFSSGGGDSGSVNC